MISRSYFAGRARDEDGAILLIVLGFAVVFGLVTAAIFSNAGANLRNSANVRTNVAKEYAGDGGIDWGLQRIRNDDTLCPNATVAPLGSPYTLPGTPPTINGMTPKVTCEVISGDVAGAGGWAVVTVGSSPSFTTSGPPAAGFTRTITGPVWSSGFADPIHPTIVKSGDAYERTGACSSSANPPSGLTVELPYHFVCDTRTADETLNTIRAEPPADMSASGFEPATGLSTTGNCRVFEPGRYNSISLGDRNYFRSGVYYFESVFLNVRDVEIVGGKPSPEETDPSTNLTPCAPFATDPNPGTGVKFVLGGTSRIEVRNPHAAIELFGRRGGPATEGTEGISIQTVTPFPAGSPNSPWHSSFVASSLPAAQSLLSVGNGNTTRAHIRGGVYAPNALVDLNATNGSIAHLLGGVVARQLNVSQEATASGLLLSIRSGVDFRLMKVASTVVDGSDRLTVSTAVVRVDNDSGRTLTLNSWRSVCKLSDGTTSCPNI